MRWAKWRQVLSCWYMVRRAETALRTVNKADESWPVDSLAVWEPDDGGPQMELQIDMTSAGDQQMEAA